MSYIAKYINPLVQFGKANYDLVLEDSNGVMPLIRLQKSFDVNAGQDVLEQEAQREIEQRTNEWLASQQIPEPVIGQPTDDELSLWRWYNQYILFCRSLGLPDVATTEQMEALCSSMINSGDAQQAIQGIAIALRGLAIMNAITQNGGKWSSITWHNEVA